MKNFYYALTLFACTLAISCQKSATNDMSQTTEGTATEKTLFRATSPQETGVTFRNDIEENKLYNGFTYVYTYNGGGLAVGDIDNDGLIDIAFTSNQNGITLYHNKGNLKFEDITEKAGLVRNDTLKSWYTGVNIVDVNGDGKNDIYLCRSGFKFLPRTNLLYINNGDGTFTEEGAAYGLNDSSGSIEATFFDFDNDGDLDCYVVNHSDYWGPQILNANFYKDSTKFDSGRHHLYRNDGSKFTDITDAAQLSQQIPFGLSATICDINFDGYIDMYVANDFLAHDLLYLNDHGQRMKDVTTQYLTKTSKFSMGSDFGDLNNDGMQDLMAVDMLPDNHYRMKNNMPVPPIDMVRNAQNNIFPTQYVKNSVYLASAQPPFSEIGYITGLAQTDWSWSTIIQDYDNDGYNDVFVTNGTKRDQFDLDFMELNDNPDESQAYRHDEDIYTKMPTTFLPNYSFKNNGDLSFENTGQSWGLADSMISSGAAYADLDNDGDLDIIVNNTDTIASIYENQTNPEDKRYLQFVLTDTVNHHTSIGSFVEVIQGNKRQVKFVGNTHGYQSANSGPLHFGLPANSAVDSVIIFWAGGGIQVLTNVANGQRLTVNRPAASELTPGFFNPIKPADPFMKPALANLNITHKESDFFDFKRDRLIPFKMSAEGPGLCTGDYDGDGLDDIILGGSLASETQLWLQQPNGTFKKSLQGFGKMEVVDIDLADLNNDGHKEILFATGSNELNDASENSIRVKLEGDADKVIAPGITGCYSVMKPFDFDKDGQMDIFAGGRLIPGHYPEIPESHLLRFANDALTDETPEGLKLPGNVRDAIWTDFDNDGWTDLIVVGEFMPIRFYKNIEGKLTEVTDSSGLTDSEGLWTSIDAADFDHDGDIDYVLGNFGMNEYLHPNPGEPVYMLYNDFDGNGTKEPLVFHYLKDGPGLLYSRGTLCEQMPSLLKKYFTYKEYATSNTLEDLPMDAVENAEFFVDHIQKSSYLENLGNGKFKLTALPFEAQLSIMFDVLATDVNGDGNADVVMVGNGDIGFYTHGKMDGTSGVVLLGDGKGNFKALSPHESGFYNPDNGRKVRLITVNGKQMLAVANNDGAMRFFELLKPLQ